MKTFKSDPKLKERLLKEMKAHAETGRLVKGQHWQNGKGGAVGCMLAHEADDPHSLFPEEFGLPKWWAHLVDTLFEGTTHTYSMTFPVRVLEATPVGIEFDHFAIVSDRQKLWVLENELHYDVNSWPDVANAIADVQNVLKSRIAGEEVSESAESAARSAAWSARSAARSAPWSAAWSAAWAAAESAAWAAAESAESAARSAARSSAWSTRSAARSAAWSAESAAESAWSAARPSARSAAHERMAEQFLVFLEESHVVEEKGGPNTTNQPTQKGNKPMTNTRSKLD